VAQDLQRGPMAPLCQSAARQTRANVPWPPACPGPEHGGCAAGPPPAARHAQSPQPGGTRCRILWLVLDRRLRMG